MVSDFNTERKKKKKPKNNQIYYILSDITFNFLVFSIEQYIWRKKNNNNNVKY